MSECMVRLSPYHEMFYNEWKLDTKSSKYNIVFDQVISANLDLKKLQGALERFVANYFIINSHVIQHDGHLCWVENNKHNYLLSNFKLGSYTEQQVYGFASESFNLDIGPLYRFATFTRADGSYRLLLVLHHILIDGSSFSEFITEISNYYNYVDYVSLISVEEQKDSFIETTNKVYEKLNLDVDVKRSFWHEKLSLLESVDLRFLRSSVSTSASNRITPYIKEVRFQFDSGIIGRLMDVSRDVAITPFSYGLCIFSILLYRYTSQSSFAIPYPCLVREYSGLMSGVGIKTNIYRSQFTGKTTLLDVFSQYNKFVKELKGLHGDYLLNGLVSEINPNIFDLFCAQTNFKNKAFRFKDAPTIKVNQEFNFDVPTRFSFESEPSKSVMRYRVRYDTTQFDSKIVEQFIRHYKKVFIDVLEYLENKNTDKFVSDLQILSPEEYKKIVYTWNKTDKDYPHDKTIHQLFEEQVERTPNNIAVVYEDKKLTYKELNEKSNQLAHYLRDMYNIKGDDLIALCLDRSEYMLVAILSTLKSGGAYVPIDPSYPDKRIEYVLKDTMAAVILTNEKHEERLVNLIDTMYGTSEPTIIKVLVIDGQDIGFQFKNSAITNPSALVKYNNLAYVIYTSGTTGNPKGAIIKHGSVVNLADAEKSSLFNSGNQICLWYSNYVFDAHVWELYFVILNGHALHIINDEVRRDIYLLARYIESNKITIATIPPALLTMDQMLKLNTMIVAGEKVEQKILDKYVKCGIKIINAYGLSETTVCTHMNYYNGTNGACNIGRPLQNVKCYVLNNKLDPVPVGVMGHLYIGGCGLALGYLNKRKLTSQTFIPNLFQSELEKKDNKNATIYNTGDLVRYLSNGDVEYIGRNDSQVKIRGHRIELEEISTVLCGYPGVKQTVVLALEHKLINSSKISDFTHRYDFVDSSISEQGLLDGVLDLLPIQEWFFDQRFNDINHWNQSFLIKTAPLDTMKLLASINRLLEYHDSFRLRFSRVGTNSYTQYYGIQQPVTLQDLDVSKIAYREGTPEFNNELHRVFTEWQNKFSIENGPLSNFGYVHGYRDGSARIYCAFHHLIIDVVSWHIIVHDLQRIYLQLDNEYVALRKGASYRQWVEAIKAYKMSHMSEKTYWHDMMSGHEAFNMKLIEFAVGYNAKELTLSKSHTDKVLALSAHTKINNIFLTSMAFALKELSNLDTVYISTEGHGREDINPAICVTRTIGWFTTIFPVKLSVGDDLMDGLKFVEKTLQTLPNNGIGYGALFGYTDLPLVSFNYLGQINHNHNYSEGGNNWCLAGESSGDTVGYGNRDGNIVNVTGWVANGQLVFSISGRCSQDKLVKFVNTFKVKILELIEIDQTTNSSYTKYLAAYYTSDSELDASLMKNYLLNQMPQYVIPQSFVWLKSIPLTINGKIDIKLLPTPNDIDVKDYIPPTSENERLICLAFANVLGKTRIGINDDFFMSGGDSISSITLSMSLRENFYVSVRDIFAFRTPGNLAQNLITSKASIRNKLLSIIEIKENKCESNSKVQDYISSLGVGCLDLCNKNIKKILLSGVTGYLGCNMLNKLLELTSYCIYVPVRAVSDEEAIERVKYKYKRYFGINIDDQINCRVFIFCADIEQSNFGISTDKYTELAQSIDSVIHAAALTKLLGRYDVFYKANIQTTINLLELTKLTKLKDFHYISTCSVLDHSDKSYKKWGDNYTEDIMPEDIKLSKNNVYLKTKLEAERIVVQYRDYDVNTNIYRVGNLAFMSESGLVKEDTNNVGFVHWLRYFFYFNNIFSGCKVELSPVDFTAEAIVKLFDKHDANNNVYHVFNPYLFDLVDYVKVTMGLSIDVLSVSEFASLLLDNLENASNPTLVMHFLLIHGWAECDGMYQFSKRIYLQNRTQYILGKLGFTWGDIKYEDFSNYLKIILQDHVYE